MALAPIRSYGGYRASTGPKTAIQQAGQWGIDTGVGLMDEASGLQGLGLGDYERYGNAADEVLFPYLWGDGGYDTVDIANLTKYNQEIDQITNLGEDWEGFTFDADTMRGIRGNPEAGMEYFDPDRERRDAQAGWDRRRDTVAAMRREANEAFDPNDLKMSSAYGSGMGDAIRRYSSKLEAAGSDPSLSLSDEFVGRYRMDPSAQERIVNQVAGDVNSRYQGEVDELMDKARASGMNPAQAAAMASRIRKEGAIQAGDAMTKARIAAEEAAAGRERDIESMRLGAAGNRGEMALRGYGAASDLVTSGLGNIEKTRMAGEQSAADSSMDRFKYVSGADFSNESDIANQGMSLNRDISTRGVGYGQQVDSTRSGREYQIASANQSGNTARTGLMKSLGQWGYGQKQGIQQQIVGAKRDDRNQAIGYATGRQQQGGQFAQQALGQKANIYGTATGAGQQMAGQQSQLKLGEEQIKARKPSIWGKIAGAASTAARFIP